MTGFEPAASCSQSRRATNCATPGYSVFYPAGRIHPKLSHLVHQAHLPLGIFTHDFPPNLNYNDLYQIIQRSTEPFLRLNKTLRPSFVISCACSRQRGFQSSSLFCCFCRAAVRCPVRPTRPRIEGVFLHPIFLYPQTIPKRSIQMINPNPFPIGERFGLF